MQGIVVLLALSCPGFHFQDAGRVAVVSEDTLEVFDAPDPGAMPTSTLRRGERVTVRREEPDGWLAITPPPHSWSWIEERDVEDLGDGRGRVVADQAAVRPGRPGAKLPGRSQVTLFRGANVQRLDRPPLILGTGSSRRRWVAIEPPDDELRFIPADGVTFASLARKTGRPVDFTAELPPTAQGAQVPAWLREELSQIETRHRVAVSGPVDQWRLEPIRRAYSDLLDRQENDESREMVQERLDQVAKQMEVAESASGFQARIRVSRARDDDLNRFRRRLKGESASRHGPYLAEGWMQPSNEQYEGRRLFALIGRDGKLSALLNLPPLLQGRAWIGNRVGVLGESRYFESLPVRLIEVRDLDLLEKAP